MSYFIVYENSVETFSPGSPKHLELSEETKYYGNWSKQVEPDKRSFEELKLEPLIHGLLQLEGSNSYLTVNGQCLFRTREEAFNCLHAKSMT